MKVYFKQSAVGLGFGYLANTTADAPNEIANTCIKAGIAILEKDKIKADNLAKKEANKVAKKK